MRSGLLAFFLLPLTFIDGLANGAETDVQSSGVYLIIGGGTDIQLSGLDSGVYPTIEAGFGYSWSSIALEIDLLWSMTDWDSFVPISDETGMPLLGGATYRSHGSVRHARNPSPWGEL